MVWELHYEEVGLYGPDKMPFKSKDQRAFLFANHPKIAKNWTKKHGAAIQRKKGSRLTKSKRRTR